VVVTFFESMTHRDVFDFARGARVAEDTCVVQ
jgi:hypothetical protein